MIFLGNCKKEGVPNHKDEKNKEGEVDYMLMTHPQKCGTNVRYSFAKNDEPLNLPNLIEIQKESFDWFLKEGLMEVLRDISPIVDYSGNLLIDFVDYTVDTQVLKSG